MRVRASFLTSFFVLALAGCGSTEIITPPSQTVTADVQGDSTAIYWLDERQGFPDTLTSMVMMGDYGQYATEYRFRKGVVREIQREGALLVDNAVKPVSMLIRYDSEGQAVYQQYRVNGDLLPIRATEMVRYAREAEQALTTARELHDNKRDFFQGYWDHGLFTACGSDKEKTLKFDLMLPDELVTRLEQKETFLAASGEVGRNSNTVEQIIALEGNGCIRRPMFE